MWTYKAYFQSRWLGLLFVFAALIGWHFMTARTASAAVAGVLFAAVITAYLLGDVVLKLLLHDKAGFDTISFRLVCGALTGMALLYVAAMVLRFGLPIDAAIIAATVLGTWLFVRKACWRTPFRGTDPAEPGFVALGLLAVTLWCRDVMHPIDSQILTIVPAWPDVFYHMSEIAAFAGSTGAATVHDVQMAGAPVHPYHFASYIFPALLVSAGGVSEWVAYAGFLVPASVMLTFLAAHAIVAPVFGRWPAAVGGLALLLLPDASQQNFGNPFMGYHWLQQVGPAGGYGVASAAMAFVFMIEACRSRRVVLIFASYFFLFVTLIFKAHIFVAIAYLLLIFPALFYGGPSLSQRVVASTVLTAVFVAVVRFSQQLPGVPVLRMDGSSVPVFSRMILGMQSEGVLKTLFSSIFPITGANGVVFGLMLLLITFGILPAVYACQLTRLRRQFPLLVWLFPILVVGNFLVMAVWLALDDRHIGRPEELSHRPFVWAYFILVAWAAASTYRLYFGDAPPGRAMTIRAAATIIVLMLVVPGYLGSGVQTMPVWGTTFPKVSNCLVNSASFIKQSSLASDIVQDANNDPRFILTALTARRPYAIDTGGVRAPAGIAKRLQALAAIRSAPTLDEASVLARQLGIQWWVNGPHASVTWASGASQRAAFTCAKFQVFHF
jgi:hypothetical protein